MLNQPDSSAIPPAIRQIATNFRWTGWISLSIQAVLGVVSTGVLILASFSGRAGAASNATRAGTGFGIFFAVCGLVALGISIYWSFRYVRISRQLRAPNTSLRPSKADTIQLLQLGIVLNLVGMLLTIVGAEAIVGGLIARAIAQPQNSPLLYGVNNIPTIQPLDFFVVQANTNTIAGHFAGLVSSFWLLNRVNR
ncbi:MULTISPECIES: DUF3611 family protein [Trichocoleus]|uniref:DUF3611 family protein n=1 Tax=Trichocoleus desertorum GB2-A4 TaxID=2933944 RepID=A0ABV0J1T5_9CYAN|nr:MULTISPECIES: DUF3611 family protein [unclassified Trichocoleus]MBD1860334.1 DUF3611 family protein [Trichocoleus sp. FACHB-46]MBD2097889.1 DUF3611 family protein [Trichocoleus sp. FACHB-591]MBD2119937.1 DUF3611 family protein [Trichocoleus sp. FACHB-262]